LCAEPTVSHQEPRPIVNPFDLPTADIEKLVQQHGTPIYLASRKKVAANFQLLDRCLPAVNLYYAVKANPHAGVLETLKEIGAGFDVASRGEIEAAVRAGADPRDDLIFADTVKDPTQIAYAHSIGLDDFTFDNRSEILQIARHAPAAKVHLRLMVSNKGSVADLSKKFGVHPEEAVDLLLEARDRGLSPRGIAFHVGSQCLDVERYVEALDTTRRIFDDAAAAGLVMDYIDIGGGFPVQYLDEHIDLEHMCARIDSHYQQLFGTEVKLTAEPGRAVVGDAVCLVTKVISESVRGERNWLYFDDGAYGSFLDVLLYQMKYPMKTSTSGPARDYVLAGPTCDSIDVFSRSSDGTVCTQSLPEMHVDDLLIAGSMGAYTYSLATRFNGFEPPSFVYID
jgi:ornithine decarboxylase